MAVLQCAGCPRLISVFAVPGGDPVAKAHPEQWSTVHTLCRGCGVSLCDRCAPAGAHTCVSCGARLRQGTAAATGPGTTGILGAWARLKRLLNLDEGQRRPSTGARSVAAAGIDEVAQRIGRVVGKPVRAYSTYDFGCERDPAARSFLIGREFPLALVARMRGLLPPGLILFVGTGRWLGEEVHDGQVELVLAPGGEPLDAVLVGRVNPLHHGLDPEGVVAKLKEYERRYGLELYEANSDSVRFRLLRVPADAAAFAEDLLAFCPDLGDQFETPAELMESVGDSGGWISLCWD